MKIFGRLLILVLILFSACDTEPDPNVFRYGDEHEFHPFQMYRSTDRRMQLTIDDVQDSRCPLNVVCFWAGEARVKMSINIVKEYEIELSTFDHQADTLEHYEIRLMNVEPYPEIPNKLDINQYSVFIKVSRLN